MIPDIWSVLQIAPTTSKREIRRAYAAQAQLCHPEEQPEEFAKLQEAYQLALRYTEQNDFEYGQDALLSDLERIEEEPENEENGVIEEATNSLLKALESGYEAELKRRQSEGALKELIALFEEPKTAKGNKVWSEFFVSDVFLQECFTQEFAEALDFYLEHQTIYAYHELPQGFLIEWAIAYAMVADMDGYMYQSGEIPMRKVVAKYWNNQDEMWRLNRGNRMLVRAENKVKIQAFSDYIELRMLEKQGSLTTENEYEWREMLWHGKPNHLFEVCKVTGKNATSIILLKLLAYWVSKEAAPQFLAEKMYQEYNLKGNEKSGYYAVYKELKEAILYQYPDIEKEDVQEAIKEWAGRLIEVCAAFAAKAEIRFQPETEAETAQMEQLFEEAVWKQYQNHPFMVQWLVWKLTFHNMPLTIAQHLYEAYELTKEMKNPSHYNCMELREHSRVAIVNYKKHANRDEAYVWEYFFQRGFGVCSIEVEALPKEQREGEMRCCIKDDRLYLPAYMKTMYRIVEERQREFLGYCVETGGIEKPLSYEFTLPDGDAIRSEYYLHYVAYYCNDRRIYKPYLAYSALEAYEKEITTPKEFFCLLALTVITEHERDKARALILKWLPQTMLVESTFEMIVECIVQNNALDRSTQACSISETESMCLMIQHTQLGMELFEYTQKGWIKRPLRAGIDWQKQELEAVLQAHMKPVMKQLKTVELKGLSIEEKAGAVWDCLMFYAKHEKGCGLLEPILPKEYPMLHTVFGEGGMGWLTDSFVVLYLELSPNQIFRQVLYITVEDWGCASVYPENNRAWIKDDIQNLQNRVRRRKPEEFILKGAVIREEYPEQQSSCVEPILFGESGMVYGRYGMAKVCETKSGFELLSKMLKLENVVRCEVYEGKMTVSAQSGQLEYCFTKEEYEEACAAYKKELAEAYAVVEAQAKEDGLFEQEPDWDDWEDEEGLEDESDEWSVAWREERRVADLEAREQDKQDTLMRMTKYYLMEMDNEERYKNRGETLAEYYCVLK